MKAYRNLPVIRDLFSHISDPMDVIIGVEAAVIDGTVTRPSGSLTAANGFLIRDAVGEVVCLIRDVVDLAAVLWVLTEKTTTVALLDLRADRRAGGRDLKDICESIQAILDRKLRAHDSLRMHEVLNAFGMPQSRHGQLELLRRLHGLDKNPGVCLLIETKPFNNDRIAA